MEEKEVKEAPEEKEKDEGSFQCVFVSQFDRKNIVDFVSE